MGVKVTIVGEHCEVIQVFFFSSRRRHTRFDCDWSSDVCSSDLRKTRVESVALPDPNLYAARALAASPARRGVAVEGGAVGTTDSLAYRTVRCCAASLVDFRGRPLPDIIFPILNSSQNWFAEMLLKILGRELKGEGSWEAGLGVERGFLTDSGKIDSTAVALEDGSGLAAGNLATPPAFPKPPPYMHSHPHRGPFGPR